MVMEILNENRTVVAGKLSGRGQAMFYVRHVPYQLNDLLIYFFFCVKAESDDGKVTDLNDFDTDSEQQTQAELKLLKKVRCFLAKQ